MRKIVLGLGISLDGYIARPDGTLDFLFMPKDYSMAPSSPPWTPRSWAAKLSTLRSRWVPEISADHPWRRTCSRGLSRPGNAMASSSPTNLPPLWSAHQPNVFAFILPKLADQSVESFAAHERGVHGGEDGAME